MNRFVALLRGINVGGATLKNTQLVELFENEGFTGVRAVLASGNVLFDSADTDKAVLRSRIESALTRKFHYEAKLVLETQESVRSIAAEYPFERNDGEQHPYVIFSSDPDSLNELLKASAGLPLGMDAVARGPGVVYWSVPKGSSLDSPFAKVVAKKPFATSLTTRNLRTVEKLTSA